MARIKKNVKKLGLLLKRVVETPRRVSRQARVIRQGKADKRGRLAARRFTRGTGTYSPKKNK